MNFVIKERNAADILPISPIILGSAPGSGSSPFPTVSLAARRRQPGGAGAGGNVGATAAAAAGVHSLPPIVVNEDELEDEYMKANHAMMSAMSEEELLKHVEELRLSVSAKSMEVMQSDKFKRKVGLLPSASESGGKDPRSRSRPAPAPAPAQPRAEAHERQGAALAWNQGDFAVSMPNSIEELEALQKSAPM